MPIYMALETGLGVDANVIDLLSLNWKTNGIGADFELADDATRALRVTFDCPCIVRILDETAVSTEEEDTPSEGCVDEYFAYLVAGGRFNRVQSKVWKITRGPVTHFQFVTWSGCMDVLSHAYPSFSLVQRST